MSQRPGVTVVPLASTTVASPMLARSSSPPIASMRFSLMTMTPPQERVVNVTGNDLTDVLNYQSSHGKLPSAAARAIKLCVCPTPPALRSSAPGAFCQSTRGHSAAIRTSGIWRQPCPKGFFCRDRGVPGRTNALTVQKTPGSPVKLWLGEPTFDSLSLSAQFPAHKAPGTGEY